MKTLQTRTFSPLYIITTYLAATAAAVKLNDPDACHTSFQYLVGTIYIKRKQTLKVNSYQTKTNTIETSPTYGFFVISMKHEC